MAGIKFNPQARTIEDILEGGFLKVPRFQRPYSWSDENVQELWTDAVVDGEDGYFIGPMVVYDDGARVYGIVDGQQRLTTLTILLCVIRDLFREHGDDDLANGVQLLIEARGRDNKVRFVLQTESSYPVLQEIQSGDQQEATARGTAEEHDLRTAYSRLREEVEKRVGKGTKKQLLSRLKQIRDRVLSLSVIWIELRTVDEAVMLFETLNSRGKDLGVADLVKGLLMKHLPEANSRLDRPLDRWEALRGELEGAPVDISVNKFILHSWLSRNEMVAERALFKHIKRKVTRAKASTFLEHLETDARLYRLMHDPSSHQWPKAKRGARDTLDALHRIFRVSQPYPMVLALLRELEDSGPESLRPKHALKALRAIEDFHFLVSAVTSQRSSGGISYMYASHAQQLSNATSRDDKLSTVQDLIEKLAKRKPSWVEFNEKFGEVVYLDSRSKQKPLVQYILRHLHDHHVTDVPIDMGDATIEHVLSQKELATVRPAVVGQVGNLLLVSAQLNRKLDSKPFTAKRALLAQAANVFAGPALLKAQQWDEAEIGGRTEAMARAAYEEIWTIA